MAFELCGLWQTVQATSAGRCLNFDLVMTLWTSSWQKKQFSLIGFFAAPGFFGSFRSWQSEQSPRPYGEWIETASDAFNGASAIWGRPRDGAGRTAACGADGAGGAARAGPSERTRIGERTAPRMPRLMDTPPLQKDRNPCEM